MGDELRLLTRILGWLSSLNAVHLKFGTSLLGFPDEIGNWALL